MGIEGIGGGKIIDLGAHLARSGARGAGARDKAAQGPDAPSESSPKQSADERHRMLEAAKETLNDLPDVRDDKVIEAKLRISTGYYNSESVRREVLRSVLAAILQKQSSASGTPGSGAEKDAG